MNAICDNMSKYIVGLLEDKKAHDITLLSIGHLTTLADFFIIVTGTSSTHIQAMADHIEKEMTLLGFPLKHREGKAQGGWLLLDYKDVIVHVFSNEMRQYYHIERIWSDAQIIPTR